MSNLEDRADSESDCSDDEDYVPEGELNELSEESKSGDEEEGAENSDNDAETGQKRRSNSKKLKKPRKKAKVEESEEKAEEAPVCKEEEKKRAEDIWAAFKLDTGGSVSKTESSCTASVSKPEEPSKSDSKREEKKEKEEPKFFEFAGETHVLTGPSTLKPVEQAAPSRGLVLGGQRGKGGLAGILSQIKGKGTKLSTLEKSKMDWQNFKAQQGIEEEIQTHNRGKQGFLERQDFLQRADLRRFEIEKQMRATARKSNH
ncbi:craniofacial development protein 1 [Cloeon dipterum]|uniref:craniofacial development protein 1 n=1 Tax=Cloeon dipterum TaxID=197152 RepID=UPI00321FACA4